MRDTGEKDKVEQHALNMKAAAGAYVVYVSVCFGFRAMASSLY